MGHEVIDAWENEFCIVFVRSHLLCVDPSVIPANSLNYEIQIGLHC